MSESTVPDDASPASAGPARAGGDPSRMSGEPSPAGAPHPNVTHGRQVYLPASGTYAAWEPDPHRPDAVVLSVGGREQSTLVPTRPTQLVYEYLQRVATVLDGLPAMSRHSTRAPASVAHLGGGALTLPRRLEVSHEGVRQVVVDLDQELMDFVLGAYPLQRPELTSIVTGDVQEALDQAAPAAPFAAVVLDIALDSDSPARLFSAEYMRHLLSLIADDGAVIINVGDEDGAPTTEVVRGCRAAGASVFVTGPSDVLSGQYTGNLVVVASRLPWGRAVLAGVRESGPQPAAVLSGAELGLYLSR